MIQLEDIKKEVLKYTGITPEQFNSPRKTNDIIRARKLFSATARKHGYTLKQIGAAMNRDHSSAYHLIRKSQNECKIYPQDQKDQQAIENMIENLPLQKILETLEQHNTKKITITIEVS